MDAGPGERRGRAGSTHKSYGQFCSLASALDVIGDRWTLLIIRELLFLGPRRFKDLEEALPGIAPNLLTARLRLLAEAGLVERAKLPPPAGASVYRLTPDGAELRETVVSLMRWGRRLMDWPGDDLAVRPELAIMAMEAAFLPAASEGVRAVYELTLDDLVLSLAVDDATLQVHRSAAPEAAVRLRMPLATFARIAVGLCDPADAVSAGDLHIEAEPDDLQQFLRVFGLDRDF